MDELNQVLAVAIPVAIRMSEEYYGPRGGEQKKIAAVIEVRRIISQQISDKAAKNLDLELIGAMIDAEFERRKRNV